MNVKIVGCGISGITAAILLREQGHKVEMFEHRDHIGGNCFDYKDKGITVHQYGSHIFHTPDKKVWDFLNRYSLFNNYLHKVRANTKLGLISIPYNNKTIKQIGKDLSEKEIQNLIFKEYSERHWGTTWENLPKAIINRIPKKRKNKDDRYFAEDYQGIPIKGYTEMFKNMLDGIKVHLSIKKEDFKKIKSDFTIYTGKPDEFFDFCYGELPYRSLRFEHFYHKKSDLFTFKKGAVINECNNKEYNRTSDNSVFLNEKCKYTIFTRDYPEEHNETNEPIYPKNFGEGQIMYYKYKKLIDQQKNTLFLGRLASYKYLDMWMAIKQVMKKIL